MFKEVMQNAGLEMFAVVGLGIFVVTFAAILMRAALVKKEEARQLSALPLAEDEGRV
jgi:hypothetical protein